MFQTTRRTCSALGAAAGSTLCAGLAVVAGVIPQSGATNASLQAAAAAPLEAVVPTVPDATPATLVEDVTETTEAPPPAESPTTVPEVTTTVPPLTTAPPPPPVEAVADPAPVEAPPAPVEPPASGSVPRREPSSAEVAQALEGLRPYVQSVFSPGPDQVAEAGDKICTAFDEGQTVEEVKAAGLELVEKVPFTTVKPGADDYVVRTAVTLYCPGHASKLG